MLEDAHTTNVIGIGDVELKSTFKNTLILNDVMHVYRIRKNSVSIFLLNKLRFSQFNGVDLYTTTKNSIFVNEIDIFNIFMNEIENQFSKNENEANQFSKKS